MVAIHEECDLVPVVYCITRAKWASEQEPEKGGEEGIKDKEGRTEGGGRKEGRKVEEGRI
jgi:hypothetical protein